MIHYLESTQVLKTSLAEAWRFFADAGNLAKITPPELGFEVLSPEPERVYPGLMIEYRVRPLFGIPVRWLTEITHVEPERFFVDEQRIGPYRIWHHEHHFRVLEDGRVEVRDRVTYVLPFGIFGEWAHGLIVRPQLERIFAYREEAVAGVFGGQ